ncbi:MAG: hypothetical protein NXI07_14240, partial [bacterium]|nr:hypothetical protein [bacterium]
SEETRSSRPPVYALNTIMQEPYRSWIDPIVLQALISVCPAYAPGSQVRLSDGRLCVVIDWDPRNPCRPTVREMTHFEDADQGEVINLQAAQELQVIECDGFNVEEFNFYPEHEHAFDLKQLERSLSNGMYRIDPAHLNSFRMASDELVSDGDEPDGDEGGPEDTGERAA